MNLDSTYKLSPNARAILDYLAETGIKTDAETIWLDLRRKGHPISICSIYDNLRRLTIYNRVQKIQFDCRTYLYTVNAEE